MPPKCNHYIDKAETDLVGSKPVMKINDEVYLISLTYALTTLSGTVKATWKLAILFAISILK